ncbi:MAG: response regulator transcription factor [Prevotella sp.]|nr:response regulator transcription factor [Prevotella sp.]
MALRRILIAEDEKNISDFVKRGLSDFDFDVTVADNGTQAWELLEKEEGYDLIILDIRMPGLSGLEVCKKYRDRYGYLTPVLMLTALGTTNDIVHGLEVGADDYMVKPFKFMELKARIESLLRRRDAVPDVKLFCGDLSLNPLNRKAEREGIEIDLSTKEYRLLECLIRNQGTVLSRRTLLKEVWEKNFDTNTNVVDVYVRYLRSKVDAPFSKKLIHTVVGEGYMMKDD